VSTTSARRSERFHFRRSLVVSTIRLENLMLLENFR
jgi:hypothetical protein